MEIAQKLLDIVIHLDQHLIWLVSEYGVWTYSILFAIVFCETGLVVTPFLPGDSLLFAVGTLAATGALDVTTILVLLAVGLVNLVTKKVATVSGVAFTAFFFALFLLIASFSVHDPRWPSRDTSTATGTRFSCHFRCAA